MLPTLIEKFGAVITVAILYAQGRIPTMLLPTADVVTRRVVCRLWPL